MDLVPHGDADTGIDFSLTNTSMGSFGDLPEMATELTISEMGDPDTLSTTLMSVKGEREREGQREGGEDSTAESLLAAHGQDATTDNGRSGRRDKGKDGGAGGGGGGGGRRARKLRPAGKKAAYDLWLYIQMQVSLGSTSKPYPSTSAAAASYTHRRSRSRNISPTLALALAPSSALILYLPRSLFLAHSVLR